MKIKEKSYLSMEKAKIQRMPGKAVFYWIRSLARKKIFFFNKRA